MENISKTNSQTGTSGFKRHTFFSKKKIFVGMVCIGSLITLFVFFMLGYRILFEIKKQNLQVYTHTAEPKFSFTYDAEIFTLDRDEAKRYGPSYMIGIKVKDDSRTGCDVRRFQETLDLSLPLSNITGKLTEELGSGNADFKTMKSDFTTFQGKKAVTLDIRFLGPLGDKIELQQLFVPDESETYSIICGGNTSLKRFYEKDYKRFLRSFRFE